MTTDVSRTLVKGTAKQRALLIANHLAASSQGRERLLSDREYTNLVASFKSDRDILIYNKIRDAFESAEQFLAMVAQFRLAYAISLLRLERLLIARMNAKHVEDGFNSLLEFVPDKDKANAREKARSFSSLPLLLRFKEDDEGYLLAATDELDRSIEKLREQSHKDQVALKSAIVAIKDYMKEHGLSVKVFKDIVKEHEAWARTVKNVGMPNVEIYVGENLRYETDYNGVSVDKDAYSTFRKDFLRG